jgi:iron complex outermembrane receptor protein
MEKLSGKRLIMLTFGLLMSLVVFGQQARVSGTVTDAADRSTLPGVNVLVKGTLTGAITGINGEYSLMAKPGDVLVFTFIGYLPQEVTVGDQTVINVAMNTNVQALEEVVVIGYGTVKKSDATGSVTAVSSKDFNKGAITTPQELLVGKSAGVVITTTNGAPGSGATIRVRGGSSLNASNDPLIIIDGVPISNQDVAGSSNILSIVNPNDIETFTILKDASATAIYGSRASNGVILITTKKGKAGSKMTVAYDGNVSVANAIEFIDVFSGDEMRQIAYEKAVAGLYDVDYLPLLGTQNTNWQKEIFRTAVSSDHNLSLSGAVKNFPYRFSVGYTDQNGIMKNTDMQRVTGSLNLNPTFFKDDLKVNINLKGMNTHQNFGCESLGEAVNMDPTQVIMDGNPASGGYFQWVNYGANLATPNPVQKLMEADARSVVNRFIGNIQLDYALPFLRDLRANLNLGTDYAEGTGHHNHPVTTPKNVHGGLNGQLQNYSQKNYNNLLDFYLNYVKDLNSISSRIDATAGYSWQHFYREGDNWTRGIIDDTHPYTMSDSSIFKTENYLVSFFGRVNYTFKDRYLLTATVRDDGSSRFAKGNQWGLFPSVALAWKIKDESFLKDVSGVTNLKLRLGWGVTGQQDVGNDYPAQALYMISSPGSYYFIDGEFLPTLRPDPYDPNIKWEETTTLNAGLDFGFVNDRITGAVDVYKRTTNDMLNTVTIPSGSNFSNTLLTNVGSMENRGVEVSLSVIPVSKNDMTLTIGFNATYNLNEVTKLLITDDPNYIGVLYGSAFTGINQVTRVRYPARSFFVNKQVYDNDGNPIEGLYVDLSGEGGVVNGDNADKYIYHNPAPDWLLGLSARFDWKKFYLSASARGSIGNYVFNGVAAGASYDQMYQIGYWKNFTKALSETNFVKRQFTSDYFVENASFLKIDNVSAGYNFDNVFGALGARISFTVQNAAIVTKYSGMDPEVAGGIDNSFYPRPRTFILGLGLTF